MNIDFLQQYCGQLPAVTSDIKWDDDLCFSVGGKLFCVAGLGHPPKIAFKVRDEEFEEMSCREGLTPAPYMARAKWVLVTDPSKPGKKEWENFITQSYNLVKAKLTRKLRQELKIDK